MSEDLRFFIPISKIDKERRTVSGYASTETKDNDGEVVSLDAVKKALPGYMAWGNIREMHRLSAVGTAREAHIDSNGLWLTARIVDEGAWQKCLEGVYKGYSIGGRKLAKVGDRITELDLTEVSIVDRPSNPDARFTVQKSAKSAKEAYLVKAPTADDNSKTLRKALKLASALAKADPDIGLPGKDGFSLPTKKTDGACDPHGKVDCDECKEDAAKMAAKATKKAAKKAAKAEKAEKIAKAANSIAIEKSVSAMLPFLTLKADGDARGLAKSKIGSGHGPNLEDLVLRKGGNANFEITNSDFDLDSLFGKDFAMTTQNSGLDSAVLDILKRAAQPTQAMRMKAAGDNLKKARGARKNCAVAVKSAHEMLKAAYVAKLAKAKKPDDNDADDDPMVKAMNELQKAFSELGKVGTFTKAAREQLKKAASRSGQRGQETGDGNEFYRKPDGVTDLSPSDLSTAGPGSKGGSKEPALQSLDSNWDGKLAKFIGKDGKIDANLVAMIAENAELAGQVATLSKMPAGRDGRRPYAFDLTKVAGKSGSNVDRSQQEILFKGVDIDSLNSENEEIAKREKAKIAGNLLLSPSMGRSILDNEFHGGVVGRN